MSSESPSCQVVVGILVPRPCGEGAKDRCDRCGKAYCPEHGRSGLCAECADGKGPRTAVLDGPVDLAFDADEIARFQVERGDDPQNAWSDLT